MATDRDAPLPCDLTQLRYVQAIAALGSLTAAARHLGVSQPTLSHAIQALEARLSTSLFLRGARGAVATATGRVLARAADDVFARLREADAELHDVEVAPAGRFAIGYHHSLGAIFLPRLLDRLAKRAPGIELSLWENIGPRVVDAVIDRTVHFGVDTRSGASSAHSEELVVVPLFRDVICVVAPRQEIAAAAPLFHVPRIPPSAAVVQALASAGRLPSRVVSCGDLELVKHLVRRGLGLGVLPWRVAMLDVGRGELRLADPSWPHEVDVGCLFYRADLHRTRAVELLREALLTRGRELDAMALPCGVEPLRRGRSRR